MIFIEFRTKESHRNRKRWKLDIIWNLLWVVPYISGHGPRLVYLLTHLWFFPLHHIALETFIVAELFYTVISYHLLMSFCY